VKAREQKWTSFGGRITVKVNVVRRKNYCKRGRGPVEEWKGSDGGKICIPMFARRGAVGRGSGEAVRRRCVVVPVGGGKLPPYRMFKHLPKSLNWVGSGRGHTLQDRSASGLGNGVSGVRAEGVGGSWLPKSIAIVEMYTRIGPDLAVGSCERRCSMFYFSLFG